MDHPHTPPFPLSAGRRALRRVELTVASLLVRAAIGSVSAWARVRGQ